jgi:hypothetical protein
MKKTSKIALEICNNLNRTIRTMKVLTPVESVCSFKTPTRAKKATLELMLSKLMKTHKIKTKDLIL